MTDGLIQHSRRTPVDIVPVLTDEFAKWQKGCGAKLRRWIASAGFRAQPGSVCLVPRADGSLASVLTGISEVDDPFALAHLPATPPAGSYRVASDWSDDVLERTAIGWALGVYQFTRYRKREALKAKLVVESGARLRRVVLDFTAAVAVLAAASGWFLGHAGEETPLIEKHEQWGVVFAFVLLVALLVLGAWLAWRMGT